MKTVFFDIDTQIDFVFPAGALYARDAASVVDTVARLNRYAASCARISSRSIAPRSPAAASRTSSAYAARAASSDEERGSDAVVTGKHHCSRRIRTAGSAYGLARTR